jgi:hypothetical protein
LTEFDCLDDPTWSLIFSFWSSMNSIAFSSWWVRAVAGRKECGGKAGRIGVWRGGGSHFFGTTGSGTPGSGVVSTDARLQLPKHTGRSFVTKAGVDTARETGDCG